MAVTRTPNRSQNSGSTFWYGSGVTMIGLTLCVIEDRNLAGFCISMGVGFIIGGGVIRLNEYHRSKQSLPSGKPSPQLSVPQKQDVKEQKQPVYIQSVFRNYKQRSRRQNEEKTLPGKSWQAKGKEITNVFATCFKRFVSQIPIYSSQLFSSVSQLTNVFPAKKEETKEGEATKIFLKPKEKIDIYFSSENSEEEKATNLNGTQILSTSSFSSTGSSQDIDSPSDNVIQNKKKKADSSKKAVPVFQIEPPAEGSQKIKKKKNKNKQKQLSHSTLTTIIQSAENHDEESRQKQVSSPVSPTLPFSSVDSSQDVISFSQIKSLGENTTGIMRNLHQGQPDDVPSIMAQVPKSPIEIESSCMNLTAPDKNLNSRNKKEQDSKDIYKSVESKSGSNQGVNHSGRIAGSVTGPFKLPKKPLPIVDTPGAYSIDYRHGGEGIVVNSMTRK